MHGTGTEINVPVSRPKYPSRSDMKDENAIMEQKGAKPGLVSTWAYKFV